MGKYGYIIPPITKTITAEVCKCCCLQAIANELSEANRLKRLEMKVKREAQEGRWSAISDKSLEDQA